MAPLPSRPSLRWPCNYFPRLRLLAATALRSKITARPAQTEAPPYRLRMHSVSGRGKCLVLQLNNQRRNENGREAKGDADSFGGRTDSLAFSRQRHPPHHLTAVNTADAFAGEAKYLVEAAEF